MNDYLGRTKTEEKKEYVIGIIKKHKRKIDKTIELSHSMSNDMELQRYTESIINDVLRFLMQLASDFSIIIQKKWVKYAIMSTKQIKMWQGGIKMASLNVTDVIKELDISKSYLYKLIDKENILIPKSDAGSIVVQLSRQKSKHFIMN